MVEDKQSKTTTITYEWVGSLLPQTSKEVVWDQKVDCDSNESYESNPSSQRDSILYPSTNYGTGKCTASASSRTILLAWYHEVHYSIYPKRSNWIGNGFPVESSRPNPIHPNAILQWPAASYRKYKLHRTKYRYHLDDHQSFHNRKWVSSSLSVWYLFRRPYPSRQSPILTW